MTKRAEYTNKMKHQLDELNTNIDKLEARANEIKADTQNAYKEQIAAVRHQSKLAVAKFDDLRASTEESWDNGVAEMEKIRDAFVHSFHYFKSQV